MQVFRWMDAQGKRQDAGLGNNGLWASGLWGTGPLRLCDLLCSPK